MEKENNKNYDFEDESPPSLLTASSGNFWRSVSKKHLLLGTVIVFLVVLVFMAVTRKDDNAETMQPQALSHDALDRMQNRFARIEERIEQVEMQLTRLPALIHQVSSLEAGGDTGQFDSMVARIDRLDKNIKEIREITGGLDSRQRELSKGLSEKQVVTRVPESRPKTVTAVHYVIQKGDTLYGIARKNEIPLKTLLEKNNLTESSVIRPGDRLMLK